MYILDVYIYIYTTYIYIILYIYIYYTYITYCMKCHSVDHISYIRPSIPMNIPI